MAVPAPANTSCARTGRSRYVRDCQAFHALAGSAISLGKRAVLPALIGGLDNTKPRPSLQQPGLSAGGKPAPIEMATQAGQRVVHSTMRAAAHADALPKADALPELEAVKATIIGCGGGEEDPRMFVTAWRRLESARIDTTLGADFLAARWPPSIWHPVSCRPARHEHAASLIVNMARTVILWPPTTTS
jgi:hypothetical protein